MGRSKTVYNFIILVFLNTYIRFCYDYVSRILIKHTHRFLWLKWFFGSSDWIGADQKQIRWKFVHRWLTAGWLKIVYQYFAVIAEPLNKLIISLIAHPFSAQHLINWASSRVPIAALREALNGTNVVAIANSIRTYEPTV